MKSIQEIFPGCRWEPGKVYQKMCTHADYLRCNEHWVTFNALYGYRPGESTHFVVSVEEKTSEIYKPF